MTDSDRDQMILSMRLRKGPKTTIAPSVPKTPREQPMELEEDSEEMETPPSLASPIQASSGPPHPFQPPKPATSPQAGAHAERLHDPRDLDSSTTLVVDGRRVSFTREQLVDAEQDRGAFLWWADLLSRSEREQLLIEAGALQSRAKALCDLVAKDPKLPEWRARAMIDESSGALSARKALAECLRNTILLREIVALLRPPGR